MPVPVLLSPQRRLCLTLTWAWTWPRPASAQAGAWPASGAWVDDRAQRFDHALIQGRWVVMTLAYGACRRICSTSLRLMTQLQDLADQQGRDLSFVVVGLDPGQDRPADWAALRQARGLDRANWHFLSGSEADTRRLAQQMGVRYWRYGDQIQHDFKLVLLDPAGRLVRSQVHFDAPLQALLPPGR